MRIGYFQYLPKFLEVKNNLKSVSELIQNNKAEIEQLDMLVFPEYFLSGPLDVKSIKDYETKMSSEQILKELTTISNKSPNTTFIMGSVLLKEGSSFYNTTLVFKAGKLVTKYTKKALIYNENYTCKSNSEYSTFTVGGIRIGLAICWDLILPEVFRKYTGKVDLIIVPSFWGIGGNALQAQYSFQLEKKYYDALGIARAYENSFALLFVNSVGKYTSSFYSDRMMGGSYFVNPPLGIVHKNIHKDHKILNIINFDINQLNKYREFYATDKDYEFYKSKKIF